MTNWNHKAISELSGAIKRCQENPSFSAQQQKQLAQVAAAAHTAEWEVATLTAVIDLRAKLCAVCRGEQLYACDQPAGWSDNCRLTAAAKDVVFAETVRGQVVSPMVAGVNTRRKRVTELIEHLDQDPAHSISDEDFMEKFSRLQVMLAEFFAREEEVIAMIGMPDSEKRQHILEHDRLLDIFHQIYMDSMDHKNTMAVEVFHRIKAEITRHMSDYDARLIPYVA